jgi:multimeric flavodoxin WrbA
MVYIYGDGRKKAMSREKILIFMGSPRREGNSSILARQVKAGAEAAGAEVEGFFLHDMNVQPAMPGGMPRQDRDGLHPDDDMKDIFPKPDRPTGS